MRDRNIGNDLMAMAQDIADIGAQYVQTGREWLDGRKEEMTGRNQAPRRSRRNRNQYRHGTDYHAAGTGSEAGAGHGAGHGYAGAGPDSYLDENATRHQQRYAVPGDTQPDYYDRPGYSSGYDAADYAGSGRRSYSGVGPKNYVRSDSRISEDLCDRLTHDHDVDASDIEVKVANGTATLEGSVAQRWMKHRAEDIADACVGVRHVENRIRVRSIAESTTRSSTSATSTADPTSAKAGIASGSSNAAGSHTTGSGSANR